jgi:hypothetical protein
LQTKQVHLADLYDVMVEKLAAGGTVNFNPRGTSMLPMLHNDGDRVEIKAVSQPLKKYDLPLYRRDDGAFVLHRVVRKRAADGTYTMCGDNQWCLERGVRHNQLIGVVTTFVRNGKTYRVDNPLYVLYCRVWVAVMPVRHLVFGGLNRLKRILKGK